MREILDLLQMMRPDTQGPRARRLAEEVVARVLDYEADSGVARKVDGQLDLRDVADVHRVAGIASECAVAGDGDVAGQTGTAFVQRPHDGGWVGGAEESASINLKSCLWDTYWKWELFHCAAMALHSALLKSPQP